MKAIKAHITELFEESIKLKQMCCSDPALVSHIAKSAQLIARSLSRGGTLYTCGNGGSACDAMHLTEELVARYKRNRPGVKAMHFMDPAMLTCWGNDFSFEDAFARYAETFCTRKDVLVAISTSGRSKNVLAAVKAAKAKGTAVIGLTGKDGGELARTADIAVIVPPAQTERTQEVHITIIHIWCELLETGLIPHISVPDNSSKSRKAKK